MKFGTPLTILPRFRNSLNKKGMHIKHKTDNCKNLNHWDQ